MDLEEVGGEIIAILANVGTLEKALIANHEFRRPNESRFEREG